MIASNIPELFIRQAKKNNNKIALEYRLRRNEPYRSILWGRLHTLVLEVAYGLTELGLVKGQNVAILSNTRYEWAICDLAVLSCGGVVVPIYPTLPEQAVNYILNNSECQLIILEDKGQLQKIRSQWENLPHIRYAIVIEDLGDLPQYDRRILSFHNLKDKGKLNFSKDSRLITKSIEKISTDDLATIIYTSGTTGPPKGVMLTHKNILSVIEVLPEVLPLDSSDKMLSFLPLSHVFERVGGLHYALSTAATVSYCSSIDQIGPSLKDSGATLMLVVPRLLEKMHNKINMQLKTLPELKKKMFDWAFNAGKAVLDSKNNDLLTVTLNLLKYKIADRLVFAPMRKKIAPKLRCFVSGGAPLSKEISQFFHIIGMPVLEGYGLTETSAPATVNTEKRNKIGTVGPPLPNVEIKIATDGEILIKGPTVFSGYYKNEATTREVLRDGWLYTGDIGTLDEEGFLKITDRKKDIIVNSAGKNIAPQNIENSIKSSPYISNVIVIGDKKKYLSALITLETHNVIDFLKQKGVFDEEHNSLEKQKEVINLINEEIKFKTAPFADYEQIRRFTVLPGDFSVESGEITPTLKVKRKFVEEKYRSLINSMYPTE